MKRLISIAMLGLLLCSTVYAQDEAAKRKAAEDAAQSWLAFVDQGDYGRSWDESSAFFKSNVSRSDWEKALTQVRAPLGTAGTRILLGSMYQTDVPNAPRGEYVMIQYKTEFAGKAAVIETITPMLDQDKKWRVTGYFVKPAQ